MDNRNIKPLKNSKINFRFIFTIIAFIVLVVSTAFTFAWFTAMQSFTPDDDLTFGTVDISTDNGTDGKMAEIVVSRADGTISETAMPGDYITANVRVKNVGDSSCYYLICFICNDTLLSSSFNNDYYYDTSSTSAVITTSATKKVGSLNVGSNQKITVNLEINRKLTEVPTDEITIKCAVYAIQKEHLTEEEAYIELQKMKVTDFPDALAITLYNEDGSLSLTNSSNTSPIQVVYTDSTKKQFYLDASTLSTSLVNDSNEELYFFSDVQYTPAITRAGTDSKYNTGDDTYIAKLSQTVNNYDLTYNLNKKYIYDTPEYPINLHPVFLKSNEGTYVKGTTPYIILSKTRTSVGYAEFNRHTNIKFLIIPNNITTIDSGGFANCSNLKHVVFPTSNLTTLGFQSFSKSGIEKLILPKNILKLTNDENQVGAFGYSTALKAVKVACKEISRSSFQSCDNLAEVTLLEGVEKIKQAAFGANPNLKTVKLSSTIIELGQYAFTLCSNLEHVDFSKCTNLTTLGQQVFNKVTALTHLDLYNCENVTTLSQACFGLTYGLQSIKLPKNLTNIAPAALIQCTNLESVIFPNTLKTIGESAFEGCSSLKTVSLPDSLITLYNVAFYNSGLTGSIGIPANCTIYSDTNGPFIGCPITSFYLKGESTKYIERDGVIYKKLDNGKYQLELFPNGRTGTFKIDNDVTQLRRFEIDNALRISKFIVDSNHPVYSTDEYGVLFNKSKTQLRTFPRENPITHYDVPSTVTSIYGLNSNYLVSLTIPSSLTSFPGCAMQGGEKNPNKIKRINSDIDGVYDFSNTKISSIGYKSLEYAINLKHLILPSTCTKIESAALRESGCNEITTYATSMVSLDNANGYVTSGDLLTLTGAVNNNGSITYTGITKLNIINDANLKSQYSANAEWSVYINSTGAKPKMTVNYIS